MRCMHTFLWGGLRLLCGGINACYAKVVCMSRRQRLCGLIRSGWFRRRSVRVHSVIIVWLQNAFFAFTITITRIAEEVNCMLNLCLRLCCGQSNTSLSLLDRRDIDTMHNVVLRNKKRFALQDFFLGQLKSIIICEIRVPFWSWLFSSLRRLRLPLAGIRSST